MTTTYYRVQKAASGIREYLTGAMTLEAATYHLNSIAENMIANGYVKADRDIIRKLPVVILAKDMRTVALSVIGCSKDNIIETKRELAELPWLTRVNGVQVYDLSADEDTAQIVIGETTNDSLVDWLADGSDDYASEQEAGV